MGVIGSGGDIILLDDPRAGALAIAPAGWPRVHRKANQDPVRLFAKLDAFRTVAEAIASGISTVPFDLYERLADGSRKKVADDAHPVAAALEQPMRGRGQLRWKEALMLDYVLHDRWAVLPLMHDNGTLELLRLPARRVSFVLDGFERITDVALTNSRGAEMLIPADQCLFDVGYDPNTNGEGRTSGFSIAVTLEQAALELEKGSKFRDQLLEGGPRVPMYVHRPADAPRWAKGGDRTRFVEEFAEYSGAKAGQAPLLEDGMELKAAPRLDADSLDYRATRLAAQIEIAIMMHFPPELIGYREGNFSNIDALKEQLFVEVLGGKIIAFRQALNVGLRGAGFLEARYYIEENLAARLASTPESQAKVLQTQVGAPIRTVNEARRMLNLPLVPGGDDLVIPLNVTKGGLASPTDTGPKGRGAIAVQRQLPPALEAAAKASIQDLADSYQKQLHVKLSGEFARQEQRVLDALGRGSNVPSALDVAFDINAEDAYVNEIIYPHAYALARAGAANVLDQFDTEFDPEIMLAWLKAASLSQAHGINLGTYEKLATALFEPEWEKNGTLVFADLREHQSSSWAVSIATSSYNFGASDAAKAAGLKSKIWRVRSDPSRHAGMNGQRVAIGDLFTLGGRWPGDPNLPAGERVNCKCRVDFSAEPIE